MTASRNLDRQLGAWFDGQATAGVPEGLLDRSLERVDATLQRPGWLVRDRGRSPRAMVRPATPVRMGRSFAVAGAVVVVAILAGLSFRLSPATNVGPSSSPSIGPIASTAPTGTPSIVQPRAASWTRTGNMTTPRQGFTATLLSNGKVLVAGGVNGDQRSNVLASAELFDPATGSWTATGSMGSPRTGHTATLLPDGKVLVAGGSATAPIGMDASPSIASAELYDPATGTWTSTGTMTTPRTGQTATLLRDGRVLVAGGGGPGRNGDYHLPTLASAELYDEATGNWIATGQLVTSRSGHSAALLGDGRVLVVGGSTSVDNADGTGGGFDLTSAELYDPRTGSWTAAGSVAGAAGGLTTVLLPNGRVLQAGVPAELYDPAPGTWTGTGSMLTPRGGEGVTLLADGKVLVEGGGGGGDAEIASAELYDPGTGSWSGTASMVVGRQLHSATLLRDGRVLVAGGVGSGGPLASAELYDPGSPAREPSVTPSPSLTATPRPTAVIAYVNYDYGTHQMAQSGRAWIVGADGSGGHELFAGGTGDQSGVAWSPNGTQLVYSERVLVNATYSGTHLYMTDAAGSAPQALDSSCGSACSDTAAAFSPDGTRLVFVRSGEIATMDLATGRVVELSATASLGDERPRWSPDGKQIVFSRLDKFGNGSAVFVVDADGRNLHQLSSATLPARLPDWSADGSRIVFTSLVVTRVKQGGDTLMKVSQDVYTARRDWTDLRRLTMDGNSIGATWTPDGRILFATGGCQFNCATSDTGGFWVMNADGSGAQLLVPGASGLNAPLWGIDAAWQPTP